MHPVGSYCMDISRCTLNKTLNSAHFTVAPKEVFYYVNAWVQTLLISLSMHLRKITHVHTEQWHVQHDCYSLRTCKTAANDIAVLIVQSAVLGAVGGPHCFLGWRWFNWSRNLCNKCGSEFSWKRNLVPWSSGLWRVFQSTLKMKENGSAESLAAIHQNTRRRNRQARKREQTFIKPETSWTFPQVSHETRPQSLNMYLSYSF